MATGLSFRRPPKAARSRFISGNTACRRAEARRRAKGLLEAGIDPGAEKKERKVAVKAAKEAAENTFAAVAEKYLTKAEREGRAAITMSKARWLLIDLAKGLADKPVHEIAPKDVLSVLPPVEAKGNYETARRLRSTIGRVLRFAVANGWAERDATADLRGALTAPMSGIVPQS